jgi:Tol biopolymer transport system component
MKTKQICKRIILPGLSMLIFLAAGCDHTESKPKDNRTVPHEGEWGIYSMDLSTDSTRLIYSGPENISGLRLNGNGTKFVFSKTTGSAGDNLEEICTMNLDGSNLKQLTDNFYIDIYPAWSPDGSRIVFLSWRDTTLDIYVMDADGSNQEKLYDSGGNDADIDWVGSRICFTRNSQIWIMDDDGQNAARVTDPPNAGQWGYTNLPYGDYDPRLSPDGTKIVFERLFDDASFNGNYDFYVVNTDGSGETALTHNGYTQGLSSWSHSGNKLVYIVSAIADQGKYDLYIMNADGSDNHSIMPDYYDPLFLPQSAVFSVDDAMIYFIGEWWK